MDDIPRRIWLQWYGEDDGSGIGNDRPEGATWCEDRIYNSDICYVRLGKAAELAAELDAALARAEAAERAERDLLRKLVNIGTSPRQPVYRDWSPSLFVETDRPRLTGADGKPYSLADANAEPRFIRRDRRGPA